MAEILVKERLLRKIERTVDALLEQQEPYMTEKEAAEFLGLKLKTMQNYVNLNKIPASMYSIDAAGNRRYQRSKLIIRG
jgi:hypothetical protein